MTRWIILGIFAACALYVHLRGRVRHPFFRQLFDHSSLMAPINCFAYAFSAVPRTPYVPPARFPELEGLRAEWQTIRDEAVAMREASRIRASDKYDDIGFNSFFRDGWKRFYLKWYGAAHPSALAACPKTCEVLRRMPTVKAAMFAELPPGARLGRHRDPFAGSLRYHLGLVTANDPDCYLDVDGERYFWRDGEGVVFDETYLHYAENKTDVDRIILFCDVERPMKFAPARWVTNAIAAVLMRAAASPNETGDKTGGLNRAFGYLYQVRLLGKRMKAWNRRAYYTFKWSLYAAIAIAIFWKDIAALPHLISRVI
ncbi:MAG: aspartyl/asparaginyl beta-hydroxylase domain-containing protein [Alphaproteobacteria bacterium]|nr:aspartyl/asparaginyl beta-hydroxylase domain-containing protein [Alphaproteobacteria bacterium]